MKKLWNKFVALKPSIKLAAAALFLILCAAVATMGDNQESGKDGDKAGVFYENKELGFEVSLPELLKDKMSITTEETEAYGETITTVSVYYNSETEGTITTVHVLSFDEMSEEAWNKMKEEGGPLGRELGVSEAGRVVVLNTLQSNPFEEGSEDFELFQKLPEQLGIVTETFAFL